MKKYKIFLTLTIIAVSFSSCSKNETAVENLIVDDNSQNEFVLSDMEAKLLLSDFIADEGKTRNEGEGIFEIGDFNTVNYTVEVNPDSPDYENGNENIPVFQYAIRNENREGYALVVADRRISKVLAYVEQGSLSDTSFIEPLRLYMRTIPEFISADLNDYYTGASRVDKPITRAESFITYYCFLPAIWGQGNPYNSQCPIPSGCSSKAPAGCVAIAIAQILAYHKMPASLNWTSILASPTVASTSSSTVINQVSNLIAGIGTQVSMNYGCTSSGANSSLAASALSFYGLQTGLYQTFSLTLVASSLQSGSPVYMRGETSGGSGHAWVCDGYKRHVYSSTDYYEYLDMNWGWSGSSNGFFYMYSPASFTAGGYTFTQNLKVIPYIRK